MIGAQAITRSNADRQELLLVAGILVKIEAEQLGFVLDVVAHNGSFGNRAAFNQLGQTNELAELALQIQTIALIRHKKNIAGALIQNLQKIGYINVVERNCSHSQSSFRK